MKIVTFIYYIFLAFIVYGCAPKSSTAVVLSEEVDYVDLQDYKTYAWLPPTQNFEEIAIAAVENQLHSRGYTLDVENPDMLVVVHIISGATEEEPRMSLYSHYDYRGPGFYSGPFQSFYYNDIITVPITSGYGSEELNYVEGTVMVDIIDRKKMEIVWRGWAEDQRNHPLDIINDLSGYIVQIFEKFPVEPKN